MTLSHQGVETIKKEAKLVVKVDLFDTNTTPSLKKSKRVSNLLAIEPTSSDTLSDKELKNLEDEFG